MPGSGGAIGVTALRQLSMGQSMDSNVPKGIIDDGSAVKQFLACHSTSGNGVVHSGGWPAERAVALIGNGWDVDPASSGVEQQLFQQQHWHQPRDTLHQHAEVMAGGGPAVNLSQQQRRRERASSVGAATIQQLQQRAARADPAFTRLVAMKSETLTLHRRSGRGAGAQTYNQRTFAEETAVPLRKPRAHTSYKPHTLQEYRDFMVVSAGVILPASGCSSAVDTTTSASSAASALATTSSSSSTPLSSTAHSTQSQSSLGTEIPSTLPAATRAVLEKRAHRDKAMAYGKSVVTTHSQQQQQYKQKQQQQRAQNGGLTHVQRLIQQKSEKLVGGSDLTSARTHATTPRGLVEGEGTATPENDSTARYSTISSFGDAGHYAGQSGHTPFSTARSNSSSGVLVNSPRRLFQGSAYDDEAASNGTVVDQCGADSPGAASMGVLLSHRDELRAASVSTRNAAPGLAAENSQQRRGGIGSPRDELTALQARHEELRAKVAASGAVVASRAVR